MVMAGAVINSGAVIGKHCIVNTGAAIDHDCVVGDYVHIAPGAHISGVMDDWRWLMDWGGFLCETKN